MLYMCVNLWGLTDLLVICEGGGCYRFFLFLLFIFFLHVCVLGGGGIQRFQAEKQAILMQKGESGLAVLKFRTRNESVCTRLF